MPNLFIDVEARFAQFQDALDQLSKNVSKTAGNMSRSFSGVHSALATLGVGLSVAGLAAFAKSAVDSVAALDDLSEKTSLTVETISQLQAVARVGGHSLEDVSKGASRFARSVSEAAGGNKELIAFFKQIGISTQDLKALKFDEIFVKFGTSIANAKDPTNALALAQKLAGKSAAELLPFYKDLAERGLDVAKVTTEMAASAEKVQKNFRELSRSSGEARDAIVAQLLPGLVRISEEAKRAAAEGDNLLLVMAKVAKATFFGDEQLKRDKQFVENVDRKLQLEARISEQERVTESKRTNVQNVKLQRDKDELKRINERIVAMQQERAEQEKAGAPKAQPEGRTVGPVANAEAGAEAERKRLKALADAAKAGDLFGKQLVEDQEEWNKTMAEASQLTDSFNARMRERTQLEEKWNDEFLGMTVEEIRAWEQLQFAIIDTNIAIEESNILLANGFDENGKAIEGLKKTSDVARDLGLAFSSAFGKLIVEGGKSGDVLRSLAQDILQLIAKIVILEPIAENVRKSFENWKIGGSGGGGGGFDILKLFGGFFGGDPIATAEGGHRKAGQLLMVGERGPELFVPDSSGTVIPNHELGGGGVTVIQNINFSANTPAASRDAVMALLPRIAEAAKQAVFDSNLRGERV